MNLYSHRTYLSVTVRPNRCGLLEPVKRKLAKKGDIVSYRRPPLACAFEDRKCVIILSTEVVGILSSTCQGETGNVTPDCIRQYNQYMGGVDLFDMRIYWCLQSNTAVPMSYRKFLESCTDDLAVGFRVPHSTRHKVPLPVIPLQPPYPPPPDSLSSRSPDCEICCKCEQLLQRWIMCCQLFLVLSHPC